MARGSDYKITKLEKGPLQRFKNQNLLIKKFGETGLQIYKAITGKRTSSELRKDLGIDQILFDQILNYMQDAGMVQMLPVSGKESKDEISDEEETIKSKYKTTKETEDTEDTSNEITPVTSEEPDPSSSRKKTKKKADSEVVEPEPQEEPEPQKSKNTSSTSDEITPIEFESEQAGDSEPDSSNNSSSNTVSDEESTQEIPVEQPSETKNEEIEFSTFEEDKPKLQEESNLSPVEKIISDKYGDIGLRVYTLIDGQRTAEEIMKDTGLTEPKLVEILDFMDEQGIIKLDYPKGGGSSSPSQPSFTSSQTAPQPKQTESGFVPMIEGDESLDEARAVPSPIELPIKAPLDIVKSVQMKAKIMLKFSNKGTKILVLMDGKNDILDISLKLDMPLHEISEIIRFMLENGMVIMKPMSRADVRKKYGDDGYSVYKRYGKEGLMLYELIGKDLTIKQMAEKITTDKAKIIDMFIFIHQVLGIELPIDKEVLSKQLGV